MTIFCTEWALTSDITPEFARRVAGSPGWWGLSWLPERVVSFEQAWAGMVLDEIVSDPRLVSDRMALAYAATQADTLGVVWEQAVVRLSRRMGARAAPLLGVTQN